MKKKKTTKLQLNKACHQPFIWFGSACVPLNKSPEINFQCMQKSPLFTPNPHNQQKQLFPRVSSHMDYFRNGGPVDP